MKTSIATAALLLFASAVHADDARWQFSLFAHDVNAQQTDASAGLHAGTGASVGYMITDRVSLSLATAVQSYSAPYTSMEVVTNGTSAFLAPYTQVKTFRVQPVELNAGYRIPLSKRWSSDLLAGVRYVEAPANLGGGSIPSISGPPMTFTLGFGLEDRTSGQAGARIGYAITPRTALQIEAWRLLRSDESPADPLTRTSVGVAWRF